MRGEFQGAPSAAGYSQTLAQALSTIDGTTFLNAATGLPYNQATIPMGPITTTTDGRFIEAYVSAHLLNHEISFGKQDDWLGPGLGGGMAYSNNAEDIYSFRINRVEPLYIPLLSRLTGPFRYEFLVGSLRGHTEMLSLTPGVPGTRSAVSTAASSRSSTRPFRVLSVALSTLWSCTTASKTATNSYDQRLSVRV